MMEISREATAEILKNLLSHGKFPVMNQNAIENAIRYLTPIYADSDKTNLGVFYYCGECGKTLQSYDKFCSECGFGVKK